MHVAILYLTAFWNCTCQNGASLWKQDNSLTGCQALGRTSINSTRHQTSSGTRGCAARMNLRCERTKRKLPAYKFPTANINLPRSSHHFLMAFSLCNTNTRFDPLVMSLINSSLASLLNRCSPSSPRSLRAVVGPIRAIFSADIENPSRLIRAKILPS